MARHVMMFVICAVLMSLSSVAVAQDATDTVDESDVTDVAGEAADSEGSRVTLRFVVTVPRDTPDGETIYLCGDDPQLGGWDGAGLELTPAGGNEYEGELDFVRGAQVQFKATRGSWQTVEKNEFGEEIENRWVIADQDKDVPVVVAAWASGQAQQVEPTLTGDIRRHEHFHSTILNNDRTLLVYLPPGYAPGDADDDRRYPVLYMHDGQNIFDAGTSFAGVEWGVDEAAERLIATGTIEPIIIVGIYNNADRMTEYTPRPDGDKGDAYARFVVEEVKPFIDRTYRTDPSREKTGVAGSSLGGLISLYMVGAHADTFGRCGGVSPSLWWSDRWLIRRWQAEPPSWPEGERIWIDMGTLEGRPGPDGAASGVSPGAAQSISSAVADARELARMLEAGGLKRGTGYEYLEIEGGRHNEAAWAGRIERILTYLYGR
ncbi:MAG: alpha/beta hydrolase-fold protein [Phycisphaerales bacterium]